MLPNSVEVLKKSRKSRKKKKKKEEKRAKNNSKKKKLLLKKLPKGLSIRKRKTKKTRSRGITTFGQNEKTC
jgi:hypothetical protein